MTTIEQQSIPFVCEKFAENENTNEIIREIYKSTMNNITLGQCTWNTIFTRVEIEISIPLNTQLIDCVDFLKHQLNKKFALHGFNNVMITIINGIATMVTLTIIRDEFMV